MSSSTIPARKTPEQLRSWRWYGRDKLRSFGHRSRAKQNGWGNEDIVGKPIIGILNTWSDLNSCHMHLRLTADAVKRGVFQAGGHPMEIPVMSVGEMLTKPTAMFHRNFLAMETEEMLRANPIDGAVLLGGCDKSTDKSDFHVFVKSDVGFIQKHLVAITLDRVGHLQQYRHDSETVVLEACEIFHWDRRAG